MFVATARRSRVGNYDVRSKETKKKERENEEYEQHLRFRINGNNFTIFAPSTSVIQLYDRGTS